MVYTAYPNQKDPEPEVPESAQPGILTAMIKFRDRVKTEYFAEVRKEVEKVQYKHKHRQLKRKGGSPPFQFAAVEAWVDFQLALDRGDWQEALPLYFFLRRILFG